MPLDLAQIQLHRPADHYYYFSSLGSTMQEAARLVAAGIRSGVVLADEQTAGVGRMGRSWISEKDAGLYLSVLLDLALPPANLPIASLLIGLATAEAIEKATQLACDLRWPNDVLIAERKVAGILPHLVDGCIVGGVGINVNNQTFPSGLRTPATSLLLASGHAQSREQVLIALLESLDGFLQLLSNKGPEAILRAFAAASSYVMNRRVVVEDSGLRGTTAGLDPHGFLLLRPDGGSVRRIASGGIRPDLELTR